MLTREFKTKALYLFYSTIYLRPHRQAPPLPYDKHVSYRHPLPDLLTAGTAD